MPHLTLVSNGVPVFRNHYLRRLGCVMGQNHHVDKCVRVIWILVKSLLQSPLSLLILGLAQEAHSLPIQEDGSAAVLVHQLLEDVISILQLLPALESSSSH